ncbi:winged-helix domain-containing protein [Nisaea nitritireducens]|uniref:winged-helix domain-containing protein n=1 Tax=Nisaea nitritireducens TaxID=568392 RepID=UPI001865CB4A|nr:winged-helix domain-containing protein [Nisaea nitritireducens]
MNRFDTLILQELDTACELSTAEIKNRINKALGNGVFCTDRVRYHLKSLEGRGYTRRSTGAGACPRISWSLADAGKAFLVHGEPKKRPPVRRYEVMRKMDVGRFSNTYFARSRGSAIYKAWLDWREIAPDSTFIEFRKRCSAQLSLGSYAYMKQFYGLQIDAGRPDKS